MINVIWYEQAFGNWDAGLLAKVFDKHPDVFVQHNEKLSPHFDRAIVIVCGRPRPRQLKQYLERIKTGVVIFTSEEDLFFKWEGVMHSGLQAWTQYFNDSRIKITERLLLGAPLRMRDYRVKNELPKKYLWSFIGQNQNPFRNQCVELLKTIPNGYLKEISGFGGYTEDGMEYQEYLDIMRQSKFVICPSGSMSADSFRVYESMESGSIPITDRRSPRDDESFDYWDSVCPNNTIFKVKQWDKSVYDFMVDYPYGEVDWAKRKPYEAKKYDYNNNLWWELYKNQLEQKLLNLAE